MINAKDKAKDLFVKILESIPEFIENNVAAHIAKESAIIAVKIEYNSLRELLINLRVCKVIESENVYLHRLQELIEQEQEVKTEIQKL